MARKNAGKKPPGALPIRDQMVQLTFRELSAVVEYRYGWMMCPTRVQQLCSRAENKIRDRLEKIADEHLGTV